MKYYKVVTLTLYLLCTLAGFAQKVDPLSIYRAEKDRKFNLIHTKLKVDFDFKTKTMNGEEWVTLAPHFYASDILELDAKAMVIHSVEMGSRKLSFNYDNYVLKITLPKAYQRDESFTVYIKYTAQPEKVRQKGSAAITQAKGLYFINADGSDKEKPTQIWTQGATESSSCWFPTIDSPNQKTTQEIYITVPDKYKTLSNGTLLSQDKKGGLRTDYWKMDQKHAPYLFFMGIGEYEIIKDSYKNIPVNYYVEPKYAGVAKDIFGLTPEMIGFYANILGVEYPWNKYSQIVGRDFVSGAMENTTAVIHGEHAYQMPGQLVDDNIHENTIAHEIFHQWFGNLVTAESWSNITLNESFANYSEYLWREYKYGKNDAEAHLFEDIEVYKNGQNENKKLVRFHYVNRDDVFDVVSYNKGGAILHMLRKYVGDKAFFESLRLYLTENKYKSAEVHQLRLAFEKVTGKDLNWFFNQWFYGSGHPMIQISYDYNTLEKTVTINVYQTQQNEFKFPLAIDIFNGSKKIRHTVFVSGRDASFTFGYEGKSPSLVLVNADASVLADFEENKVLRDYINQLKYADNYVHKREALLEIAKKQDERNAFEAIANALSDDFYKIRQLALENINLANKFSKRNVIDKIKYIARNDKKTLVRAAAIETLGKLTEPELRPIFEKALNSKSYSVLGKALVSMYYIDKDYALKKSKEIPAAVKEIIKTPLTRIYLEEKDESEIVFIAKDVLSGMFLSNDKKVQALYKKAYDQIANGDNTKAIQNLVNDIVAKGTEFKQFNFDKVGINMMREMVQKQNMSSAPNKVKNIAIIKEAIGKLVQ